MSKDLQTVKKQVDEIITQTKWRKKDQPQEAEEMIADESLAPE